jgi:hypothetical protein
MTALEAWQRLRTHLNLIPLAQACGQLGLQRKSTHGELGPMVCPRHECRSVSVFTTGGVWCCLQCSGMGCTAALLAAHVAGWLRDEPDDDSQLEHDIPALALEALCSGFVEVDDPKWLEVYAAIPGSADFEQRGIFENDERGKRVRAYATALLKSGMPAVSVTRSVWAWSSAFCRPPMGRSELAEIVAAAARESLR